MRHLIATAFIASSLIVSPGVVVSSANAVECPAGVPAGWMTPGGYCDIIEGTKSLTLPGSNFSGCNDYQPLLDVDFQMLPKGTRVHVADTCYVECRTINTPIDDWNERAVARLHLIASSPQEACAN